MQKKTTLVDKTSSPKHLGRRFPVHVNDENVPPTSGYQSRRQVFDMNEDNENIQTTNKPIKRRNYELTGNRHGPPDVLGPRNAQLGMTLTQSPTTMLMRRIAERRQRFEELGEQGYFSVVEKTG